MPTIVQFRRGTSAQNDNFIGAPGELTVDTDTGSLRVHIDGTPGGTHIATVADVARATTNVTSIGVLPGLTVAGDISAAGTVTGAGFAGDGSQLTNLPKTHCFPTFYETALGTVATSVASSIAYDITDTAVTPSLAGTYRTTFDAQFSAAPGLVAEQCHVDLVTLISQINNLPGFLPRIASFGSSVALAPGKYTIGGATTHTGDLIYDAQNNPDSVWIIKCGAAHAVAAAATSTLINGAKASNIFWVIDGALTIGAACKLKGTYIGKSAIAPGDVFNLEGRLLTTSGAITTSNTTFAVPVGTPPELNLGILASFVFFTPAGAISNTVVPGGTGDVATGGGAVTGFGTVNGSVYLATDVDTKVSFGLYANNVLIPTSVMCTSSKAYNGCLQIGTSGQATVTAGQMISVKIKVSVGTISVANRTLFAIRLTE